jgi:hypothetical protein
LSREIRYLKGLMRDLFKAKGLIKWWSQHWETDTPVVYSNPID